MTTQSKEVIVIFGNRVTWVHKDDWDKVMEAAGQMTDSWGDEPKTYGFTAKTLHRAVQAHVALFRITKELK